SAVATATQAPLPPGTSSTDVVGGVGLVSRSTSTPAATPSAAAAAAPNPAPSSILRDTVDLAGRVSLVGFPVPAPDGNGVCSAPEVAEGALRPFISAKRRVCRLATKLGSGSLAPGAAARRNAAIW